MSFITDIFNGATGGLLSSLGDTVKKFVTTDTDRAAADLAIQKQVEDYTLALADKLQSAEVQLTERQKNDMTSDSWLSKNVRPLSLIYLTVITTALAYLTIFFLPVEKNILLTPWINMLSGLLMTVYCFYFGSRGFEKITSLVGGTIQKKQYDAAV